ncbi:MAG: hypothetical protein ACI89U_001120 [Gammaproteobacteria bacterium]|jgi:hypothetical protein
MVSLQLKLPLLCVPLNEALQALIQTWGRVAVFLGELFRGHVFM